MLYSLWLNSVAYKSMYRGKPEGNFVSAGTLLTVNNFLFEVVDQCPQLTEIRRKPGASGSSFFLVIP